MKRRYDETFVHKHDDLSEATRAGVVIRDDLIRRARQANDAEEATQPGETKMLVGVAVGAEFSVTGLHCDRIEKRRDGLERPLGGH